MTDYSKLSDREIDRLVLNIVYGRHANDKDVQRCWSRGGFKYTNNPDEAWPIIISNRIGIVPGTTTDKWAAHHGDWDIAIADINPLRAAMIVFLTIQEDK